MPAPIRLESLRSLPTSAVFNTRAQNDRFVNLAKHWLKDNPTIKVGSPQFLIAERYLILHVLIQTLHDRRYFFDGTPTSFQNAGADHSFTMSAEDQARKSSEFWKWYPELHRWQMDLLKLAMASNVNLNLTGEVGSIHSLFGAMDNMERQKVKSFRNGSNKAEEITDLI